MNVFLERIIHSYFLVSVFMQEHLSDDMAQHRIMQIRGYIPMHVIDVLAEYFSRCDLSCHPFHDALKIMLVLHPGLLRLMFQTSQTRAVQSNIHF